MEAKFSPRVKDLLSHSRQEAFRLRNEFVSAEHLLLGLIKNNFFYKELISWRLPLFFLRFLLSPNMHACVMCMLFIHFHILKSKC